ncbi:hypothetical protein ACWDTT_36290 [Streptosporangium sandarakinum]
MRPAGRLADLVGTRKTGGLLGDIQAHLLRKADAPSDRRQDVVHPSEMAKDDWCPRATYYRIRDVRDGKQVTGETFSTGTLAIFEEGHSLHEKWQRWVEEMGELAGQWKCLICRRVDPEIRLGHPARCSGCLTKNGPWAYAEVPMDAEEQLLIVGHSDGYTPRRRSLIEVKSIGLGTLRMDVPKLLKEHTHKVDGKTLYDLQGLWDGIKRPLPPHLRQGAIYVYIAQLMGLDVEEMIYLYEFKANQQTKSFVVRPSERILRPLLDKALDIKAALDGESWTPDRAHDNPKKKPCSTCPWADECWKETRADDQPQPEHGGRRGTAGREALSRAERTARARAARRDAAARPSRRDRAGRRDPDGPVR